ncbi:MAG TPA: DUF1800 domain-containing protein [Crocinitomicaceae bacterium]|nr:DUF1800 domain-containing protein [Crocinitomicaceae bacterium]
MPDQGNGNEISYLMTPYTGPWTKVEAAHLLRRTMFGPTNQQMLDAVTNGMAATVTSLLQMPAVGQPLTFHPDETIAAFGTTWINSVYPTDTLISQQVETARLFSLAGYQYERMNKEPLSIGEKMTLFWVNHFGATATFDSRASYDYYELLRSQALGNFKQLVKDVTINPNMLLFLNGASNNVFSPNENFARELLELFTIGKGPQIGIGDYTNYTEQDVAEGAKILTGYWVDGLRSDTITNVTSSFNALLHDATTKTLSAHFGNASIPNGGATEYSNYIDIIFQQNEVAKFICRKLYRYFVNYDLTATVETLVITEMANTMIANNYDVLPVLTELFSSDHFYDVSVRGALIKGPLDLLYSMFNATSTQTNFDLATDYEMQNNVYWLSETLGQSYLEPPNVAGWPAYYQEPSYSKLWVNATHLKSRFDIATWLTILPGITVNTDFFKVDALTFLDNLSDPINPNTVIDDMIDVFTPKSVNATQKIILKAILTNSLPDSEWIIQYSQYIGDPNNSAVSDPVRQRVELTLNRLFQMPEFHTM